jgi:hypothetical protein
MNQRNASACKIGAMSAKGHKRTSSPALTHVRSTPASGHGRPARADVRYGAMTGLMYRSNKTARACVPPALRPRWGKHAGDNRDARKVGYFEHGLAALQIERDNNIGSDVSLSRSP